MNQYNLHLQAEKKWQDSPDIRRRYPTFEFYWYEQYSRVYSLPLNRKLADRFARTTN